MAKLAGYLGAFFISDHASSDYAVGAGGGFTGWSMDVTCDMLDTTDFDSSGDRTFLRGLKTWTVSADKHWVTGVSDHYSLIGSKVLMKAFLDDTNASDYYVGWGTLSQVTANTPVDALIDESLTITGSDGLYMSDTYAALIAP